MISINKLTISYGSDANVLNQLQLNLETNKIHGLVGLNGAGKTSLLNALHGLIKPKSGSFKFQTEALTKKQIAYLPTENYFYPNITGREYLELFPNKIFNISDWNEIFQLPLDQVIDDYSTGMKKKLAIFGVLKLDKPFLILDEPFNGLDLESGRVLHSILLTLRKKNKTILITSHILNSLFDLCDYIHYLEAGVIKESTSKEHFHSFQNNLYDKIRNKTEDKINDLLAN
ncbi:MAG: ATP-binding cassette domain-containing protein [Reichenbachiella sp.]|uniref:ATP-binding cassette domain-containing protein n=1 Tax=Reichenbachiella sp. TaxID=2184521 RepID=UPI0032976A12